MTTGQLFLYDGRRYKYLRRDNRGIHHALRLDAVAGADSGWLAAGVETTFESLQECKPVGQPKLTKGLNPNPQP